MAFAIVLLLDEESSEKVRSIWRRLADAGGPSQMIDEGHRPHVTLGVCEELIPGGCEENLQKFARSIKPFPITLPHLGAFTSAEATVFLGVTPTENLIGVHADFHAKFGGIGRLISELYLPGEWVPHCTLANPIAPEQIPEVMAVCRETRLPIRCRAERIAIIEFPPWRDVAAADLG